MILNHTMRTATAGSKLHTVRKIITPFFPTFADDARIYLTSLTVIPLVAACDRTAQIFHHFSQIFLLLTARIVNRFVPVTEVVLPIFHLSIMSYD